MGRKAGWWDNKDGWMVGNTSRLWDIIFKQKIDVLRCLFDVVIVNLMYTFCLSLNIWVELI